TVRVRRRLLQDGVGGDHLSWDQVLADAEVLQRALRLRTPELVGRHLDRAKAVVLDTESGHGQEPPLPETGGCGCSTRRCRGVPRRTGGGIFLPPARFRGYYN